MVLLFSDRPYRGNVFFAIAALSGALMFWVMGGLQAQAAEPFADWLAALRQEAVADGIAPAIVDAALPVDLQPIPRVIELDRKQPEGTMTFARYRERIVHPLRISEGRKMMQRHATALAAIEQRYGVAPQYVVALWGIETNYGANTGGFSIVPALATLAWDGRRGAFFRKELMTALEILDQGHIAPADMKGSWAGAMGQNQFMPSSFMSFAVDGNGDGHKDIWTSLPDVFASSANYLARSGWTSGQRWGREVVVPAGFSSDLVGLEVKKTLSDWQALGVKLPSGASIPVEPGMKASLVAPDGLGGPTFLVYDNFRTIMRWNKSTYFATSVGLLANAIAS